ncbi:uncharacterized protein [Haliotis cracherodii]|uniref:uncharacterized protein n=1 Tax=Haliotis cracherodii TaxID=6455 RepID=UPI0039E9B46E
MHRRMDHIKSWLGIQNPTESPLVYNQQEPRSHPASNDTPKPSVKTDIEIHSVSRIEPTTASERLELIGQDVRDVVARVIPLEEDDCLSCKLIGSTTLYVASVFVFRGGMRFRKQFTGFRRGCATASYSSFAFALFLLGTSRLFDLGIFQKNSNKTIFEMAQDDVQSMVALVQGKSDKKN